MASKGKGKVAPSNVSKPSLYISGSDAKKLRGVKPGGKVTLIVTGTVTNLGIDTYSNRKPTASVEISKVIRRKGKR